MTDSDKLILGERQVYTVRREEDDALISWQSTRKAANIAAQEYYDAWQEECRIGVCFVLGTETIGQRNANNEA